MTYLYLSGILGLYIIIDGMRNRQFQQKGNSVAKKMSSSWHNLAVVWLMLIVVPFTVLDFERIAWYSIPLIHSIYFLIHEVIVNKYLGVNAFSLGDGKNETLYKTTVFAAKKLSVNSEIVKCNIHLLYIVITLCVYIYFKNAYI